MKNQKGFTYIELILYIALITVFLGALVFYAWGVIGSGSKSTTEQEVFSQARFVSERIKYEIRNATGINSVSGTSISLTTSIAGTNPTIIDLVGGNVRIKQGVGLATNINSSDVIISSLTFTNYSSTDNKSKHVGVSFVLNSNYGSTRQEFVETTTVRTSAEIRTN